MGLLNRLRIFLVLASCCLLNPCYLEAGDTPRRIDRIEIVRKDIFDTTRVDRDRHFLGAAINTLHILTREDVIRRELLFSEGDELDEELLGESARTLRGLGYLGDAMVTWRPSGDSAAIVTVTTQDRWSIDLLPSYKQEGNAQTQLYTARDDNFQGGGHSLSFSYSYRSYLPSPHGTEVALRERNLLGTRLRAGLRLLSGWEGSTSGIWFERPYYSDRSRWAGGILAEFGRRRITRYENGILQAEPERHSEMQRGWFLASLGSNYILHYNRGHLEGEVGERGPGSSYLILRFDTSSLGAFVPRGTTVEVGGWSEAENSLYHHFAFDPLTHGTWFIQPN